MAQGEKHEHYKQVSDGSSRFDLQSFWAEKKEELPLHFKVYVAEVGCKQAASANVESVFSGAGKFMQEAPSTGPVLLQRMIRLHYNWKYRYLRPTIHKVSERYNTKFRPKHAGPSTAPRS